MFDSAGVVLLFFGGYLGFLFYVCRGKWQESSRRLTYRITDIWGFIVGITPTLLLLTFMIDTRTADHFIALMLLALGQCTGVFLALLDNQESKRAQPVDSFMNVVAGALSGIGLALIYCAIVFVLILALIILLVAAALTYGTILLPIIFLLVSISTRKKKRAK